MIASSKIEPGAEVEIPSRGVYIPLEQADQYCCPLFLLPVEYGEDPNPLPDPDWEGDPWNY